MKAQERTYGKDEAIFREGDPSDSVFVVVSGRVELSKLGPDGPVVLAMLGPLEMFGEMGIFDDGPRSATARAAEKTRLRVIGKGEFKLWLDEEPGAALRVIRVLAERLRAADARIAGGEQRPAAATPGRAGLIDALSTLFKRRRRPAATAAVGNRPVAPFVVGVPTLTNDIDNGWTRALMSMVDGRSGFVLRALPMAPPTDTADQNQVNATLTKARQLLAKEEILDLLVWGDVHADGYTLLFCANGIADEDRPGSLNLLFRLELAADQETPVADLFYLALLTAIEPMDDDQRQLQRQLLPAAAQGLTRLIGSLPVVWNMEQQRSALAIIGHAAATIAAMEGDAPWYDRAAEAYRAAILRLPRGSHDIEEAGLRKHLAGCLLAAGDRRRALPELEEAVAEYRGALECLARSIFPQEWAGAQNRLGMALYKLDLMSGRPELLKEAMGAFQAALQVFTRGEAPQRWSDVMNNLAQVLQVYGDQMKSPEVLERAIDACRAALEFRPRARMPIAWAAAQNTLGTALFLLDKHRQSSEHLDEAAGAFTGALEVYRQYGAARPAAVAEKNLAHVERMRRQRDRNVAMPNWAADKEE